MPTRRQTGQAKDQPNNQQQTAQQTVQQTVQQAAQKDSPAKKGRGSEMLHDTLRAQSLIFDELGGVGALVKALAQRPADGWQTAYRHLLYERFAAYYVDRKRYHDAAQVLLRHNAVYPDSPRAQGYHVRVIAVYAQGGFAEEALEAIKALEG